MTGIEQVANLEKEFDRVCELYNLLDSVDDESHTAAVTVLGILDARATLLDDADLDILSSNLATNTPSIREPVCEAGVKIITNNVLSEKHMYRLKHPYIVKARDPKLPTFKWFMSQRAVVRSFKGTVNPIDGLLINRGTEYIQDVCNDYVCKNYTDVDIVETFNADDAPTADVAILEEIYGGDCDSEDDSELYLRNTDRMIACQGLTDDADHQPQCVCRFLAPCMDKTREESYGSFVLHPLASMKVHYDKFSIPMTYKLATKHIPMGNIEHASPKVLPPPTNVEISMREFMKTDNMVQYIDLIGETELSSLTVFTQYYYTKFRLMAYILRNKYLLTNSITDVMEWDETWLIPDIFLPTPGNCGGEDAQTYLPDKTCTQYNEMNVLEKVIADPSLKTVDAHLDEIDGTIATYYKSNFGSTASMPNIVNDDKLALRGLMAYVETSVAEPVPDKPKRGVIRKPRTAKDLIAATQPAKTVVNAANRVATAKARLNTLYKECLIEDYVTVPTTIIDPLVYHTPITKCIPLIRAYHATLPEILRPAFCRVLPYTPSQSCDPIFKRWKYLYKERVNSPCFTTTPINSPSLVHDVVKRVNAELAAQASGAKYRSKKLLVWTSPKTADGYPERESPVRLLECEMAEKWSNKNDIYKLLPISTLEIIKSLPSVWQEKIRLAGNNINKAYKYRVVFEYVGALCDEYERLQQCIIRIEYIDVAVRQISMTAGRGNKSWLKDIPYSYTMGLTTSDKLAAWVDSNPPINLPIFSELAC